MKETVTLQLGTFSNHVGSHFWNFHQLALLQQDHQDIREQEVDGVGVASVDGFDSTRFWRGSREGQLQPRLLISDFKDSMGQFHHDVGGSELFEDTDADIDWEGPLSKLSRSDDVPDRNPFQLFLQECGAGSYDGESAFVRGIGRGVGKGSKKYPSESLVHNFSNSSSNRPPESCIARWTDFSSFRLDHEVNLSLLPRWTTPEIFDSFLSSYMPDVLSKDYIEAFMDKLRFLAEECDSLNTIQIFADIHNGFGSLTTQLSQEIREDYGKGVHLPVWAFAENSDVRKGETQSSDSQLSSSLRRLNVPLVYANLCEHASIVVPIAPAAAASARLRNIKLNSYSSYHLSAVIATAIEAATGVLHHRKAPISEDEWYYKVTSTGRFPICELETAVPFPLAPSDSLEEMSRLFGPSSATESARGGTFAHVLTSSHHPHPHDHHQKHHIDNFALNPFAHSLSSTTNGEFAVSSIETAAIRGESERYEQPSYFRGRHRPFTNMVSIRGPCPDGLPQFLFSKCDSPTYLITACIRRQNALAVPSTFPHFFCGVDINGCGWGDAHKPKPEEQRAFSSSALACSHITVISAVGCDARVGVHMGKVATEWSRSASTGRIRAQIEKTGLDKSEMVEINEKLLDLGKRYEENSEL